MMLFRCTFREKDGIPCTFEESSLTKALVHQKDNPTHNIVLDDDDKW